MWVWLPHLPFHCWSDDALRCIRNSIRKYIDWAERKENIFSCVRIFVEVDLEKGILEAILISLDNWQLVQQLDYKQLPFKCKVCHEYGHFVKNCKKVDNPNSSGMNKKDQWQEVSWNFGPYGSKNLSSAGPSKGPASKTRLLSVPRMAQKICPLVDL